MFVNLAMYIVETRKRLQREQGQEQGPSSGLSCRGFCNSELLCKLPVDLTMSLLGGDQIHVACLTQTTETRSAFAALVEGLQANHEQSPVFQLQRRSWQGRELCVAISW